MTQDTQSNGQDGDRLDSWKKIAAYLGKDMRTAIRWSKDQGMPVYRNAGSKHGAIYAYRSEIDEWIHSDRSKHARAFRKPVFIWIGAVFVLILITAAALLWLYPSTDQLDVPIAERPWVLITDFDNRSGEARFDGTVETALRRELANSRHVLVVAPERIRDTLALMKQESGVTIDAILGREICLRYGGSCTVLTGRVDKFDSSYLLSLEVVDPTDGRSVASAEEEAAVDSKILPAVRRLGYWLRKYLGEELSQISRDDEQLEQVTTPSLRALELYSRGMQVMRLWRWADAEVLFRQAVTEDPEFASANLFVFWALYNQGKGFEEEAQSFLERAMELAGSTSEQERYFIEGTYYDLFEVDHEKACESNKILVELFPDHYWAAGNAAGACCGKLGHREACVRYLAQGAKQRVELLLGAAMAFTFLAGDFDRARPDVERLRGLVAEGGIPAWKTGVASEAAIFTEFFSAEEYLDKGLLPDVVSELQRVELALGSMGASARSPLVIKLVNFYLALGQFRKARALGHEKVLVDLLPSWLAYLEGDQAAFQRYIEDFRADYKEIWPEPTVRLVFLLRMNMSGWENALPVDVLVPLYDPDTAVAMASPAGEPAPEFLSWPKFQAKLQLVRGKQMLNQGRLDEAIVLLKSGVRWFRDHGGWEVFQMYFMGAEFLAVAYAEQGNLQAAYRVLEDAAGQRNLVNSFSAPLHQKIQARRALLARELGRTAEAEAIEAELAAALNLADWDHPILVQLREQQNDPLEIE